MKKATKCKQILHYLNKNFKLNFVTKIHNIFAQHNFRKKSKPSKIGALFRQCFAEIQIVKFIFLNTYKQKELFITLRHGRC